jgi:hypothetical protein
VPISYYLFVFDLQAHTDSERIVDHSEVIQLGIVRIGTGKSACRK